MRAHLNALVLVAHGSRAKGFEAAFKKVRSSLARDHAADRVVCAYLELNRPSVPDAIAGEVRRGARRVTVMPYFLLAGRHTAEDIPALVRQARQRHPKTRIRLAPYLGFDARIADVVKERIRQAV